MAEPTREFSADFFARVRKVVEPGSTIHTLSNGMPNRVVDITPAGVVVETERSNRKGAPPLIPAWMIEAAWERLRTRGRITNRDLLDDLNVRRSSFVCALLAKFPEVAVAPTRPITLELRSKPS